MASSLTDIDTLEDVALQRRFGPVITEALSAFSLDPTYLLDMAARARAVRRKDVTAQVKEEVAAAKEHFRSNGKACRKVCGTSTLCGYGPCAYASEENRSIIAVTVEGAVKVILDRDGTASL